MGWFSDNRAQPYSGSRRTVLCLSKNRALVLGQPCSGSRRTVLRFSENRALVLGEPCSGSRRTVLWFSENRALVLREPCSGCRRPRVHSRKKAGSRDPGSRTFFGRIRKVEARLGKSAKIRKVETD